MISMRGHAGWLLAEMGRALRRGAIEDLAYRRGFKRIAGLDEVGRGSWAGPVVAAAVILPRGFRDRGIRDSKRLTPKEREELAPWIKEVALAWGVAVVPVEEIDRMNILNASLLAMAQALKQCRATPDLLLIDGAHKIPSEFMAPARSLSQRVDASKALPPQKAIRKGDDLCYSIAAASILAKVTRDGIMIGYDKLYPQYGFAKNKGYGSREHLAALESYGLSPIHRRSFEPVRDLAVSSQRSAVQLLLLEAGR